MKARMLICLLSLAACGGSQQAPAAADDAVRDGVSDPAQTGGNTDVAVTSPSPGGAASIEPGTQAPQPKKAPMLAFDSYPPGVSPLGESEATEVRDKCGAVMGAAKAAARKDRRRKPAAEYVEQLAQTPPKIADVDVPHCLKLILRDTRAYVAKSSETGAANNMKRIIVGLSGAMMKGKLCPSAPPVPAELGVLKSGPVTPEANDYAAPGWMCVRFATQGAPQHWQYEVRTAGTDQS
jgi:hypothetical protein